MKDRKSEIGLSLIELAVALIVVGLLTSSFLQIYSIQQDKRRQQQQNYKIFTIKDGISSYLSDNGHYPCPARRDRGTTDSDFAESTAITLGVDMDGNGQNDLVCNNTVVADNTCSATEGYCVALGLDGVTRIRIGSIPYKEIGVGKEDVIDVYGNQFTYAIVEGQASEAIYELTNLTALPVIDHRNIQLLDVALTDCDAVTGVCAIVADTPQPVDIIFFSHGENGAGSFTSFGGANLEACSATLGTGDQENCDNDHIFVTEEYAARSPSSAGLPDDTMVFHLLDWTYIWDNSSEEAKTIYNRASGNMAVGLNGADLATEKLHIARGNLRVEANADLNTGGKIQTTLLCDENNLNCFNPELIAGVDPVDPFGNPVGINPNRLRCGDGYLMAGIADGAPICRSVLLGGTASCGNLEYATGFNLDSATGQITLTCAPYVP